MSETNGTVNRLAGMTVEQKLEVVMTEGYVPTVPWGTGVAGSVYPLFQLRANIEQMLWHPMVHTAMEYYKSGIAGAEFWGGQNPQDPDDEIGLPISDNPAVTTFVKEQCERFWDRAVPLIQESGYPYGWSANEAVYAEEQGCLRFSEMRGFAPTDSYMLTQSHCPVGVRVKSVLDVGQVDLWMASGDIPAKGIWYAHNPRYSQYYGRSQLVGAWLPWRRAAWKDGAEQNVDMAVYRFGTPPILGRYPNEDIQNPAGTPYSKADSQGLPRTSARDMMRRILDQLKSGASVGLPSDRYAQEMGGDFKYSIEMLKLSIQIKELDAHIKTLYDQIAYGIGVPPELIQAAETGSGYSGRMIPVEAFLDGQQKVADRILHLFVCEILKPLVRWNFGDVPWDVKVKKLLLTKQRMAPQRFEQTVEHEGQKQKQQMDGTVGDDLTAEGDVSGQFSYHRSVVANRIREIAREAIRRAA